MPERDSTRDIADISQHVELLGKQGLHISRIFTKKDEDPLQSVEWEIRSSAIKNPDGSAVFEMHNMEIPKFWTQVATDIVVQKYFRKKGVPQFDKDGKQIFDEFGKPVLGSEVSVRQVVKRLAGCWRHWGEKFGYFATPEDAQAFEDELAFMIVHQMASPNSPQWFNAGLNWAYGISGPPQGHWYVDPLTKQVVESQDEYTHPQLHACFIQPIKDDLVNPGGILDLAVREARVFKLGSGTGTNFSTVRADGEPLSGGGRSSGLMSFLKIFDAVAGSIKSGGTTRRASKIVIVNADHPEIESFISWKINEEKKVAAMVLAGYSPDFEGEAYQTVSGQNSNNSVRVPNEFVDAVLNDRDWNLIWRTNGKIIKTVKAKELWNQIARAAWTCGDPGLQFDTIFNDWHTCPETGRINATNPCSEFAFVDNTSCNLASLNLMKFFDSETAMFDVESFKHAVRLWAIVLEISVLMAQYPSKEIAEMTYKTRSLGLGYTNLGSMLMVSGIPYDSDEARAICAAITAMLTGEVYATSAEMASFLGTFPEYEKNREHMLHVIRNHRRVVYNAKQEEYEKISIVPPSIDHRICPSYLLEAAIQSWDRALDLGDKYGYRNAQATLIAPTGTTSLQMDCDTTGIEPDFSLVKFKKLVGGGYFKLINQSVLPALKRLGYTPQQINEIFQHALGKNTLRGAPYVNDFSLKTKGFTDADISKIEKLLPGAFDITQAFSVFNLGKETLERLGFSQEQCAKQNFNVLKELGFTDAEIDAAGEYACGTLTLEGAPHLKEEHYAIFDCANRCGKKGKRFIDYMAHVKMMAAVQPLLSGSISKTINMPHEATIEDVKKVYIESWKLGLKSIALYRDGSKLSQPLMALAEREKRKEEHLVAKPVRKRLPAERHSLTHKFRVGNQEGYITVGLFEDGAPGEIFISIAKEGSTLSGLMDALALSVSISLQYGVPLKVLVSKFVHSRFEPSGWTDNPQIQIAKSIVDYIFRWLALKFLPEEDLVNIGVNKVNGDMSQIPKPATMQKEPVDIKPISEFTREETIDGRMKTGIEADELKIENHNDATSCSYCGSLMIRSGSCYLCLNCGATSGCS
jgi:ribonucleoside-diphosphate reductase alpha chain